MNLPSALTISGTRDKSLGNSPTSSELHVEFRHVEDSNLMCSQETHIASGT
jgi:hypothetical protein